LVPVPEPIDKLGDRGTCQRWIREKKMVVYSLASAKHPMTIIDLFVNEPLKFQATYARAVRMALPTYTSCNLAETCHDAGIEPNATASGYDETRQWQRQPMGTMPLHMKL
jgi:hypothetical protein